MTRIQIADSHLTYIGASSGGYGWDSTVYDVYGRERGMALGVVVHRRGGPWVASDEHGREKAARTRWEAATALWGTSADA